MTETHTFQTDKGAHAARRVYIERGRAVSLVALHPSGWYVFDSTPSVAELDAEEDAEWEQYARAR